MAGSELLRLIPTGMCWCGCGEEAALGKFFTRGHDKTAEAALLAVLYGGSVPQLLREHGYGPERSVTEDALKHGWQRCVQPGCTYVGAPAGVANHAKKTEHNHQPSADPRQGEG
jgi:hypothetical protein